VLHIGDSFAGALGLPLGRLLEERGVRSVLEFETASYIPTWAHQKDVRSLVRKYAPDLVLISLGANELEIMDPEQRAPTIQKLVAELEGRPCVWIAPPLWEPRTGLLEVIRERAAPCRYLDTSAFVLDMERARDGVHPTMQAREDWARIVLDWLARERAAVPGRPWQLRPGP
jgi:lysophospholipase L1-like esterase